MKAYEKEMKEYTTLNSLASRGGTVLFGGTEDGRIPVGELKQAFCLDMEFYNRSVSGLSVRNAALIYAECAAGLQPDCVLLHIGAEDIGFFEHFPTDFDRGLRELIACVRGEDRPRRIAVISLENPDNAPVVKALNKHLRYVAEAERCEFCDISSRRLWNPQATREVVSFVHDLGFMRPLKTKKPLFDIIKILYGYTQQAAAAAPCAEKHSRPLPPMGMPEVPFV